MPTETHAEISRKIIQGTIDAERSQLVRDCRSLAASLEHFAAKIEENECEVGRQFTPDRLGRIAQNHGRLKGLREALRASAAATACLK